MARPRRAQRPAPEGVDPHPAEHPLTARASEDKPEGWGETPPAGTSKPATPRTKRGENDDRLRQDRPPHWG